MAKMSANSFVNKAREVLNLPTVYQLGGAYLQKKKNGKLLVDCSGLIKGILWGYPNGGKYASNGVPDINANTMITRCSNVTTDFTKAKAGWIVWMKGHIGIYIGEGRVIESSPRWKNGVQLTFCQGSGYNNTSCLNSRKWTKCGMFQYIDYSSSVTPSPSTPSNNSSNYYPRYSGNSVSISSALSSIGVDGSYANRKKIAITNGFANYSGTASQNTKLLDLLKKGLLVKVGGSTSSVSYYPRYTGSSASIASALKAVGVDGSYANRKNIAAKNGIANYRGTAAQNTQMLSMLKNGILRK